MKRRKTYVAIIVCVLVFSYFYSNLFPGNLNGITNPDKPIILYYNYGESPVAISQFTSVVSFASSHGFNTLMIVVYINHNPFFNSSTLHQFYAIAKSENVTFVPSYYITSLNDTIDTQGFSWVNLDMERLSQADQSTFYDSISASVPLVSVTQPYSEPNFFHTKMLIVESYASGAVFWLEQMAYYHYGTICSVHVTSVSSKQEYKSQFQYCLEYSDGVMVFDYPSLQNAGY